MLLVFRGAYGCAVELVQGIKTNQYMSALLDLIKLLENTNSKVILVFDGQQLPAKVKYNLVGKI